MERVTWEDIEWDYVSWAEGPGEQHVKEQTVVATQS